MLIGLVMNRALKSIEICLIIWQKNLKICTKTKLYYKTLKVTKKITYILYTNEIQNIAK